MDSLYAKQGASLLMLQKRQKGRWCRTMVGADNADGKEDFVRTVRELNVPGFIAESRLASL